MPFHDQYTANDGLYARLVALAYDPFMQYFERRFMGRRRRELLTGLQGNILEVGAGTGANFPYYDPRASVLALEPSGAMLARARRKLKKGEHSASIRLLQAGIDTPGISLHFPDGGFDAIVLTLVLCTVPAPEAAIARFQDWLRAGGRLYVLEHIIDDRQPVRSLQQGIDPLWKHLAAGCHLTRPTDELLKRGGFLPEWERYYQRGIRFYHAVLRAAT